MYDDTLYGAIVNWYRDTSKDRRANVLYAWVSFYGDDYIYTTTLTPNASTFLYSNEGTTATKHSFAGFSEADSILSLNVVRNASSGVVEPEVRYDRASNKDIILTSTLYTDSTTLVEGATLYNNLGEDSEMKVSKVNQDGSFEGESNITITLSAYETRKPSSGTINDIAFAFGSDKVVEPSQVVVPKDKECIVSLVNSYMAEIYLDGELLAEADYTVDTLTTSFTPTKDCTLEFIVYAAASGGQD